MVLEPQRFCLRISAQAAVRLSPAIILAAMETNKIVIRGAREHNLQDICLELPRNRLIVFTGVSGSGKSSLAFDTLYAEGQRRYLESLSSYARQFLGQLQKPDVDYLAGLSPAISIQQKTAGRNPRSTVGTITEIHDLLRVLFARIGHGHCPQCGRPVQAQSRDQIVERILALPERSPILILAPLIREQKGEYKDLFAEMLRRGYLRARVDGQLLRITEDLRLDRQLKHNIDVVVDRLVVEEKSRSRIADAVEQALQLSDGTLLVLVEAEPSRHPGRSRIRSSSAETVHEDPRQADADRSWAQELLLSAKYACAHCGVSYDPPSPQLFSFNSPQGMCRTCDGLGEKYDFDPTLLVPDPNLSFAEGAVEIIGPLHAMGRWRRHIYEGVAASLGIDLHRPWKKLPAQHRHWLLYGAGDRQILFTWRGRNHVWKHYGQWEGIIPQLLRSFIKTPVGPRRLQLEKYMRVVPCPACQGTRLNPQARAVRVGGKTLPELCAMPIGQLTRWLAEPEPGDDGDYLVRHLTPLEQHIAAEVLKEIRTRLQFLTNVGLHYLTLDRPAPSLSGGEAQRIRLARQIGSGLVGVLYILDEPSIGLHPRDNARLLASLKQLRDLGNTVIVVEHDEDTIRAADYLVDFGPGPGVRGGRIVACGTLEDICRHPNSLTGQYLSGRKGIPVPERRRCPGKQRLRIYGACHNNLKNIDVEIPLGLFVCVTGVSGSGKSSLVNEVLLRALKRHFGRNCQGEEGEESENGLGRTPPPGRHRKITGLQYLDKVIAIDQSPIGRTPRSNPATYIKVFDEIRQLFASLPTAKVRGYKPGRFSFNVAGGRCEACQGHGANRLEMDFLADIWVPCEVCEGRRFNRETLQVEFKGKNIHQVLQLDVQEALELFANQPKIHAMLQTLHDVGLDYIKLGQPSPTLSGGEAQRIKLARELCRRSTGRTLYILDEPTTGLHFDDIAKLLRVLHELVDRGNTVLVIEHNLEVVKTADWVIDLGPEGGEAGGYVVCAGPPETIAECPQSYTGQALQRMLRPRTPQCATSAKPGRRSARRRPAGAVSSGANAGPEDANGQTEAITHITVRGAQQHNLKNVSIALPRERMTVFCGPSGSGKTSLAVDTIYAEGQRRYIESLSAYARQFLGGIQKPKVEQITGLSPAICIEQKNTSKSPRSTVGTVTEIHDYLRVLYARLGQMYCPRCQIAVTTQTADEIIDRLLTLPEGTKLYILAPVERRETETYAALWEDIRRGGFLRVRVDGKTYSLDEVPNLDRRRRHEVQVVVDRVVVRNNQRSRLADAVEQALEIGRGLMQVAFVEDDVPEERWRQEQFSQHLACRQCGRGFEPLNPHHFSFNSPLGWCPACEGLGVQEGVNPAALIRDGNRSLQQGAIAGWPDQRWPVFWQVLQAVARHHGIPLQVPLRQMEPAARRLLFYGGDNANVPVVIGPLAAATSGLTRGVAGEQELTPQNLDELTSTAGVPGGSWRFWVEYKGLFPAIDEAARISPIWRQRLEALISEVPCSVCHGARLRDDAAAVRFHGKTLHELGELPLREALTFFRQLRLSRRDLQIAGEVLREIEHRLQFLVDIGLDYLTLNRPAPTLSGGEAQRIQLAAQLGSGLTGVLYVLDEPTIGLHPRDNRRLIRALEQLRDLGNTLILVEHDREVIAKADYLVDFGPGAGDRGGEIVADGPPAIVQQREQSLTGQYLSGRQAIPVPASRRLPVPQRWLIVLGARQNNLKNINVAFPLGCFIAVTGVSGSGKSSLVQDVLYNTLARKLHRARTPVAACDDLLGIEHLNKVINVDQSPIGSTPASNPATYTGVFDLLRELYAQLPEARVRGYTARRFSFNRPGGRCEACEGQGQKRIEMHFLPDVWVECEVCHGTRYNAETLQVRYKGYSISDVLNLRVSQALEVFAGFDRIRRVLQTLADVGLDYIPLGQPAPTLSGGEAQRVKLAAELTRPNTGHTLYILDEPTTGLHFDDIRKLLEVLHRLVDMGHTVIVIEHNLDIIKNADWVIDLGPEAGDAGGYIVACGTPEDVAHGRQPTVAPPMLPSSYLPLDWPDGSRPSHTRPFLAEALTNSPRVERRVGVPESAAATTPATVRESLPDMPMPWESDGVRWHTQDRLSRDGQPCRWDGRILLYLDEKIHELGEFAPTDWNHRTRVEIAWKERSKGWFMHAYTGDEWLLWLTFRVARNTFRQEKLEAELGILPCNETPGLEGRGDGPRVRVANERGPWQRVELAVHWLREVQGLEFDRFLRRAVRSFTQHIALLSRQPEDFMPWKVQGQRWHLSPKGFPPGQARQWPISLLTTLVAWVQKAVPQVVLDWSYRDVVVLRFPDIRRPWARWNTKQPDCLQCAFAVPKGSWNLAQLDGLGAAYELDSSHRDVDILRWRLSREEELAGSRVQELLRALAESFRQRFGTFAADRTNESRG